jgi:hypothetical protein
VDIVIFLLLASTDYGVERTTQKVGQRGDLLRRQLAWPHCYRRVDGRTGSVSRVGDLVSQTVTYYAQELVSLGLRGLKLDLWDSLTHHRAS